MYSNVALKSFQKQSPIKYPIKYNFYNKEIFDEFCYQDSNLQRNDGIRAKKFIPKYTTILIEQPLVFIESGIENLLKNSELNSIFNFSQIISKLRLENIDIPENIYYFGLLAQILLPDFKFKKALSKFMDGNLSTPNVLKKFKQSYETMLKVQEIGWECLEENIKNNEISLEYFEDLLHIIMANYFDVIDHPVNWHISGLALYPKATKLNHSCCPNCFFFTEGTQLIMRTLFDIGPNEELTNSYIAQMVYLPKQMRSEWLSIYNFDCLCPLCTKEEYQQDLRVVKCPFCTSGKMFFKNNSFNCKQCFASINSEEFMSKVEEEENSLNEQLKNKEEELKYSILDFSHYLIVTKFMNFESIKKLVNNLQQETLMKIYESVCEYYGEEHYNSVFFLEFLAEVYRMQGKIQEVMHCLEKMYQQSKNLYGNNSYNTMQILNKIENLHI